MSDISWLCRLDFCSINNIKQLPRDGPADLYPRRKKTKDYINNIFKLADGVEQKPWFMRRAAQELRNWVTEKHVRPDLLDISFILDCLKFQRPPSRMDPMDFFVDQQRGNRVTPLEPAMKLIQVVPGRMANVGPPTMAAEHIYATAAMLVGNHGYSWRNAIEVGEQIWSRMPAQHKRAMRQAIEHEGMPEDQLLEMPVRDL